MTSTELQVDHRDDYSVYQTSTFAALLAGIYDGDVTVEQLLRHGDFGLGTFNHLDGEMVVLDGVCHHLRSDGTVTPADGAAHTPFAAVTRFHDRIAFDVTGPMTLDALEARIDAASGGENASVAVRVDGTFTAVRTRTVSEQHQPYVPFVEVTAHQTESSLTATTGTVVGFRTPKFEAGISVVGYHLHYVDDARARGGHVLDLVLSEGRVSISPITQLHLILPESADFLSADLHLDRLEQEQRQTEG
ncbi:acetolactate decarboxylase [Nakamurella alba]|nr:acetolactate decarboxylase [Nakamurella alba]